MALPQPSRLAPSTTRPPQAAPPPAQRLPAPEAGLPPELVHSILASRTGTALPLFPVQREAVARAALAAGAGNGAVASIVARMVPPEGAAAPPIADENPAQPAPGTPRNPDPTDAETARPKPPGAAPAEGAAAPPPLRPGGAAPAPATAAPPISSAGNSPAAVQQAATQTAAAMPQPPTTAVNAPPTPEKRNPTPRRQIQQMAGPPPVPMATPAYADIADPIPDATKKIEEVANRKLPDQVLPPVTASPGGHTPNLTVKPLTPPERRLLLLGEAGMNAAQLPESERAKIRDARDLILAAPAAADPAAPAPTAPETLKVSVRPLPAATLSVAERDLFTAALAQLLADPKAEAEAVLTALKNSSEAFPNRILANPDFEPVFAPLGKGKLDEIETRVRDAANPMAAAMGVAGKILDDAVAARQVALEEERKKVAAGLQQGADAASKAAADNADTRNADAAAAKAIAADARKRAAATKKKPKPTFREIADAAAARIKDKVAEAIARFQLTETERGKALDEAMAKQIEACKDAVTADQLAAAVANKIGPDQPPLTDATAQQRAREAVSKAINAAKAWLDTHKKLLEDTVKTLKADAARETAANIKAVEDEGAAAFKALRGWGDTQDGATESWWQDSARNLENWADNAHDTATTWADAKGKLARLQMQRDLEGIKAVVENQLVTEGKDAETYAKLPTEQRQRLVDTIVTGEANRPDIGKSLADALRQRVTSDEKKAVDDALTTDALALPAEKWDAIEKLAQAKNPGFHAAQRSDTIFKSGEDKLGTDEKAIYEALGGLSKLETNAVKGHYFVAHGHTLDWALADEMSGDELRRAQKLLEGDKGAAAAEAIHDAVWGPGTDEKAIMDALRGLTETERKNAIAHYRKQYGEDLETRLAGDMEGADLNQAKALLQGKSGDADAIAIDGGLRGGILSPDRESITAVYDRVRQESLAKAKAEGWTSAEFDAEVARRNGDIEKKFGEHFAGVPAYSWGGSQSTLRTAITAAYPLDPANRKLVNALADNDMATADAALMQTERNDVYADDSVLKGVVRKQYDRAFERAQLDRGPELARGVDAGMKAWLKDKVDDKGKIIKPFTEEDRQNERMRLQRESDAALQDAAFDGARANSKMLDAVLQANHGITLDNMISQNMSWGDKRQAQAELKVMRTEASGDTPQALKDSRQERRRDWAYTRVRYAIEGVGTDMDELKGGLAGLDKKDLEALNKKWSDDHDGETLRSAVQSDTSGREEDDLLDLVDNGAPQTVEARMDELRRRLKRDEDSVGALGALGSRDAAKRSHDALAEMEALTSDLRNPNLDPRKREFLADEVDRRIDHASAAIEAQRARVDALADMIGTIFQYVIGAIAIVVGAIIAVLSGGTAVPALAAIVAIGGSLLGTIGGMAIKASIKGGAYGSEEFLTDAVVGVVDLAVTIATLGTVKGGSLLSAAKGELMQMGKASIKVGLAQAAKRTVASTVKEAAETAGKGSLARRAASFVGRNTAAIAKNQAHQFAAALPTALVGSIMNERNLRSGNAFKNIAHGTIDASIENLKMGAVMGGAGHAVTTGLGKIIQVQHPVKTPIEVRTAEFRTWKEQNPGRPPREFVVQFEERQVAAARDIEVARLETRAARKAMLEAIPPREHAGFADVPIVRVNEAEFKALNKGQTGDAMLFRKDGQTALVIREGAPASAAASLSAQLRGTVAPGTAGRSVNPAEALPQRLQNRVPVDIIHDPSLGLDGVRVVPMDPDGVIRGVRLEIGPNARAADIQKHIATIDGVRKFEGLAGKARQAAIDVANAIGADIVSPRERGRWEAALEVEKLKGVIEDRMQRLAEEGASPSRARAIADEIAGLGRQLDAELARLALGSSAEAKGYIAAIGTRKGMVIPEDPKAVRARKQAQKLQVELGEATKTQKVLEAERTQLTAPVDDIVAALRARIDDLHQSRGGRPERLEAIIARFEAGDRAAALQALREHFGPAAAKPGREPGFADLMLQRADAAQRIEPQRAAREKIVAAELATTNARIEQTKAKIARTKYSELAGDGRVPMHPSLPPPLAGRKYFPLPEPGKILNAAELQALHNNQNGFLAELRLANRLAEQGKLVIQYGHKINEHGADMITIDPATGRVELWDAKHHGVPGTGHSDTFEVQGRREKAVNDALAFLVDRKDNLPPALHRQAVDALTTGDFDAITSHTTGGSFTDRRITFQGGRETGRD